MNRREFPTVFYDVAEDLRRGNVKGEVFQLRLDGQPIEEYEPRMRGRLKESWNNFRSAHLFFAPGNLASRIMGAKPPFVARDMIQLPFERVFIEFAEPVERGMQQRYGLSMKMVREEIPGPLGIPARIKDLSYIWYYRLKPDDGRWHAMVHKVGLEADVPIDGRSRLVSITKGEEVLERGGVKTSHSHWSAGVEIEALCYLLFINSSNIGYELRQAPKLERRKDRHWWKKDYERKFEELVIREIPRKIKLGLARNESGAKRDTPYFVRGHFKVLSYCGSCGARKSIRRFLMKETCKCKTLLDAESAKTQIFWWEGHWAAADMVGRMETAPSTAN